ncbi:hypothetical protein CPA56_08835 [Bombella sp. TMW2.1889]|uniref:Uncharacterized protein n=1 Tax=Bombella mellum TaxID=2039288 RepID=A0ABR5ZUR8_9PROT|nr:hypothetical protein [Bombella mellum]
MTFLSQFWPDLPGGMKGRAASWGHPAFVNVSNSEYILYESYFWIWTKPHVSWSGWKQRSSFSTNNRK